MTLRLRQTSSIALSVTLLGVATPVPALAEPACSVIDGVLVCAPEATDPPHTEPPADPDPAPEVSCEIVDATLVCTPANVTPEPEATPEPSPSQAPAPPPTPAPDDGQDVAAPPTTPTTPDTIDLPLSLTDAPLSASENVGCPRLVVAPTTANCQPEFVLLVGHPSHELSDSDPLTRGQTATMLSRFVRATLPQTTPSGTDHFEDDDGAVHEAAINLLADLDILRGTSDQHAMPTITTSASQFALLLHRTLTHTGHLPTPATSATLASEDLASLGINVGIGPVSRGRAAQAMAIVLELVTS